MPDDYRIRQVLESVEDDPSRSLLELAHLVSVNSSRLGHLFRLQVEIDLSSFVRNARLKKKQSCCRKQSCRLRKLPLRWGIITPPVLIADLKRNLGQRLLIIEEKGVLKREMD